MNIEETLANLAADIRIPSGNYRWSVFGAGEGWLAWRTLAPEGKQLLEAMTAGSLSELLAMVQERISDHAG